MSRHRKKDDLPGWFPFAIGASLVLVIAAGSRANWTLAADMPKEPPPPPNPNPQSPPPVQQAGLVHGWPGVTYNA